MLISKNNSGLITCFHPQRFTLVVLKLAISLIPILLLVFINSQEASIFSFPERLLKKNCSFGVLLNVISFCPILTFPSGLTVAPNNFGLILKGNFRM